MSAKLEPGRGARVELDYQRPHRPDRRAERFFVQLARAAAGAVGEVVRGLAVHLGLACPYEVHGAGDGAHDPPGVG